MRGLFSAAIISASIGMALPASAAIVGFTSTVDLGATGPYTVNLFDGSSYTFSALTLDGNDTKYRTIALATTGSATAYGGGFIGGGTDYTSYSAGSATPGNNFGGDFITAPTARPIDYSLADTFVALRFGTGADLHYGYAEVAGSSLLSFAYNDVAGGSITTGERITGSIPAAVPEPATWAMFIGGFGMIGGAMRRRQRTTVRFA
jgi:hypothetical protein